MANVSDHMENMGNTQPHQVVIYIEIFFFDENCENQLFSIVFGNKMLSKLKFRKRIAP